MFDYFATGFCDLRNYKMFNDFTLIHRGLTYHANTMILCSLSPVISKRVFNPEPASFFEMPPLEGDFNEFMDALCGKKLNIDATNCRFIHFMAEALQIRKLADAAKDVISRTNVVEQIIPFTDQLLFYNYPAEEEINILSYNLKNVLKCKFIYNASPELISKIINNDMKDINDNNKVSSLDKVLFINKLLEKDPVKYNQLKIDLAFLQTTNPGNIVAFSTPYLDLNAVHLKKYIEIKNSNPYDDQDPEKITFECLYSPGNEFNGILKYLIDIGNPANCTSKTIFNENFSVNNLFINDSSVYYSSLTQDEEFICFNFGTRSVKVSHYSLGSWKAASKGTCPSSWVLEGSDDNRNWLTIDEVEDDLSLMSNSETSVFTPKFITMPFCYIRFRQIKSCHHKNQRLILSQFELFGVVTEK